MKINILEIFEDEEHIGYYGCDTRKNLYTQSEFHPATVDEQITIRTGWEIGHFLKQIYQLTPGNEKEKLNRIDLNHLKPLQKAEIVHKMFSRTEVWAGRHEYFCQRLVQ